MTSLNFEPEPCVQDKTSKTAAKWQVSKAQSYDLSNEALDTDALQLFISAFHHFFSATEHA